MTDTDRVTGTIVFPANLAGPRRATVYVRVEDVSLADASATTLAESVMRDVPVPPTPEPILSFSVPVPSFDPRARYSVLVLVDLDGDGQVGTGDLISTQSHPVLTRGFPAVVTIPLTLVG